MHVPFFAPGSIETLKDEGSKRSSPNDHQAHVQTTEGWWDGEKKGNHRRVIYHLRYNTG